MRNGFKGAREFDVDSFAAGQAVAPGIVGCVGTSEILPHHLLQYQTYRDRDTLVPFVEISPQWPHSNCFVEVFVQGQMQSENGVYIPRHLLRMC